MKALQAKNSKTLEFQKFYFTSFKMLNFDLRKIFRANDCLFITPIEALHVRCTIGQVTIRQTNKRTIILRNGYLEQWCKKYFETVLK